MNDLLRCAFCEDIEDRVVIENSLAIAFWDKSPVSKGHCLIIPKRHIKDYFSSTRDEKMAILDLLDEMKILIDERYMPEGYNIGINCGEYSGQTIMHLHIHLIPRYKGDVIDPRGGVRGVIPGKQNY